MSATSRVFVSAAVACFFLSCVSSNSSQTCRNADECDPGYTCRDGYCLELCTADRDCAKVEQCVNGLCERVANPECAADSDCSAGGNCVAPEGTCLAGACGYTAVTNGTACSAGSVAGWCWSGVCVPRGCGDGVVENGEACDDRNTASGDGCLSDCTAVEAGYSCFDGLPCRLTCRYDGTCPGRIVTILLALDGLTSSLIREALVEQAVDWVTPTPDPNVLYVRDDHTAGESTGDLIMVNDILAGLTAVGVQITAMDEPPTGLTTANVSGFDVVWFANPGYPIDDAQTLATLREFALAGGGVVLQGDDMAWTAANGEPSWGTVNCGGPTHPYHADLTGLSCVHNGHAYCNKETDNISNSYGGDAYVVTIETGSTHPVIAGIGGQSGNYVNDIDIAAVRTGLDASVRVLATATISDADFSTPSASCPTVNRAIPVIVAQDLNASWSP